MRRPYAGGAPPSPTHSASSHDPVGTSSGPKPTEFPEATPLSPRSYRLGPAGGYDPGEGSPLPWSKNLPCQHSWVAESLWDNPEFIQAGFNIGQFLTTAIDTEAEQVNIKAMYSELESASSRLDVSNFVLSYHPFSVWI
jgi:hypothetical protein